MNTAYVTVAIRAIIQFASGLLFKHGIDIGDSVENIVSAIVLLATVGWSIYEKNKIKSEASK